MIDVVNKVMVDVENKGKVNFRGRTASAATTDGNYVFVYGGIESNSQYSKNLSIIQVRNHEIFES